MDKINNNIILPDIHGKPSKTPIPELKENYKEAYEHVSYAKNMINDRLNKLNSEKNVLEAFRKPLLGGIDNGKFSYGYDNFYNMNYLSAARNTLGRVANNNFVRMSQSPYNHNFAEPFYYPLEMPVRGEPLKLPGMEIGRPVPREQKIGGLVGSRTGITTKDLMMILLAGNGQLNPSLFGNLFENSISDNVRQSLNFNNIPFPNYVGNSNSQNISNNHPFSITNNNLAKHNDLLPSINNHVQIKNNRGLLTKVSRQKSATWWNFIRNFAIFHKYYQIALKYSRYKRQRDALIDQRTRQFVLDLEVLRKWLIDIQKSFFDELVGSLNTELSLNKTNVSKVKLEENYQKISALLNIFIKNLYKLNKETTTIPEKIISIISDYIKPNAIFPRKYLTTYEVNRLDFYLNGELKNVTDARGTMIITYLVISRCFVQTIMLHYKELFPQHKSNDLITNNAFVIGSILHYLTNDTFKSNPPRLDKLLSLNNYYRNNHLYNKELEENSEYYHLSLDKDELANNLLPVDESKRFLQDNSVYIERFKGFLFNWGESVMKQVRLKLK